MGISTLQMAFSRSTLPPDANPTKFNFYQSNTSRPRKSSSTYDFMLFHKSLQVKIYCQPNTI